MKLTQLEVHGFKSFADRVRLSFADGVTGVVGPNGCGKSNVIDAFRWVLGAQKTSQLRSDKMENVIFNGTAKRKRANLAEVSVTFENTKNILPTEFSTVTITRKLYRDGESEYRLNDVPCRLKDILNLFMDTGIGADSYAIIELGMVSDILTDKNDSRRNLFEEAAGISKYKVKKKEALGKLDDTQQNLERVEDLLFEIEKNLKTLERQAKRAEKYFGLKTEYRALSLQLALLHSRHLREKRSELTTQLQAAQDSLQGIQTRIAGQDAEILEMQTEVIDREQNLAAYQKQVNAHLEEIRKQESEKSVKVERLKYLQQREADLSAQVETARADISRFEQANRALEAQIDEANDEYDKHDFRLNELETALEELRLSVKNRQERVEEMNQELRAKEKALQAVEKDAGYLTIQIQSLQQELERTAQDKENRTGEMGGFQAKITELEAEIQRKSDKLEDLKRRKSEVDAEARSVAQAIEHQNEERLNTQRQLDALQNEFKLTKSLVENLEGYPESLKFLKKASGWAARPTLLSDIFYTDEPYKLALETYLEPYLNCYVVDNAREAMAGIHLLRDGAKGRANFFVLDAVAQTPHARLTAHDLPHELASQARPVLDVVEFDDKYAPLAKALLGGAFLVFGDVPSALQGLPPEAAILHISGSVIARGAQVSGGSVGLFQGKRIGRAKNLERLQKQMLGLQSRLDEHQGAIQERKLRLQELQNDQTGLWIEDALREQNLLLRELSVLKAKQEEYQNVLGRIGKREQDVRAEIERLEAQRNSITPKSEALQDDVNALQQRLATATRELNERSEDLSELTQQHTQANFGFMEAKNRVASLKKDFLQNRDRVEEANAQLERIAAETARLRDEQHKLVNTGNEGDDNLLALYQRKKAMEEELGRLEFALNSVRTAVRTREDAIRTERRQKEELSATMSSLREQESQVTIALAGINQRLDFEFQLSLDALVPEEVFGDAGLPTEANLAERETQVLALRDQLQRFGEVNPTAIEAYKEIKERYDFMAEQRDDLMKAKADLLQTITEIDETAKEKFLGTFNAVREHFVRVFKSLFSEDDKADLVLKDPENPLESPIEITAQPKGKRPLTINQLSGGEKTLTAISLLFSIYLIKPAPFCIFDEVDAPLDDANIDKFNRIITEFSANSQFILVTHNKRTMAKTNVLYGVTMEEAGVSRVLPVSLEQLSLN